MRGRLGSAGIPDKFLRVDLKTDGDTMTKAEMKRVKMVLILLNVVFGLCGLLLLLQSSLTLIQCAPYSEFVGGSYTVPLLMMAVTGVGFNVAAIASCAAAMNNHRPALSIVSFSFLVLVVLQVSASVASLALKGGLETTIDVNMLGIIEQYTTDERSQLLDAIQSNFQCCGANSITDWFTQLEPANNYTVPLSCCNTEGDHCKYDYLPVIDPSPELEFYTKGCGAPLAEYLNYCQRTLDIAGTVTIFIEIACLVIMFYYIRKGRVSKSTIYKTVSTH